MTVTCSAISTAAVTVFVMLVVGVTDAQVGAPSQPAQRDSAVSIPHPLMQRGDDLGAASGPLTGVSAHVPWVNHNADWTPVVREFDGVPMVLVPPGCFMMGMIDAEIDALIRQGSDESWVRAFGPQHPQCIDAPFWIDKTEVTQADFERLGGVRISPDYFEGDQRPVENVSWFEARDFCALREVRLPTEREWEYAARGPDSLVFPWGKDFFDSNAVWNASAEQGTAPVGSRAAGRSWVGAFDMSGNVWEWVNTAYGIDHNGDYDFADQGETLYAYPYTPNDGREIRSGDETAVRVLRGGSWYVTSPDFLRAAIRVRQSPDYGQMYYGFRCARSG